MSAAVTLALAGLYVLAGLGDVRHLFALMPGEAYSLTRIPLFHMMHANFEHLLSNGAALLILGTLAGTLFPKGIVRAIPLLWLGSGLLLWFIGRPGSFVIGASAITYGLFHFIVAMGLFRRDKAAIAGLCIACFLYGSMWLAFFPSAPWVSWEGHTSGAVMGWIAAWLWRGADPPPWRPTYSWEQEDGEDSTENDGVPRVLE